MKDPKKYLQSKVNKFYEAIKKGAKEKYTTTIYCGDELISPATTNPQECPLTSKFLVDAAVAIGMFAEKIETGLSLSSRDINLIRGLYYISHPAEKYTHLVRIKLGHLDMDHGKFTIRSRRIVKNPNVDELPNLADEDETEYNPEDILDWKKIKARDRNDKDLPSWLDSEELEQDSAERNEEKSSSEKKSGAEYEKERKKLHDIERKISQVLLSSEIRRLFYPDLKPYSAEYLCHIQDMLLNYFENQKIVADIFHKQGIALEELLHF